MFVWALQTLWADFLSEYGDFCWDRLVKDISLVTIELIELMF